MTPVTFRGAHDRLQRWGRGCRAAKRAGEGRKQPASALSGKTVTLDLQGAALGGNDADGECPGGGRGWRQRDWSQCTPHCSSEEGEETAAEKGKEI